MGKAMVKMTEMLMEILWPESTPERQQRNFKVALHRLKKTIEPDMPKKHVSSYLKHEENRLILNMGLCRLDADRFSSLCTKAETAHTEGDNTLALKHYKEALTFYEQILASGTTDEDLYLQMIKIQAVLGHLDAVHSTYRQLCTILRDELDAEPSMEITAAYQAIVHPKKTSNELSPEATLNRRA